MAPKIRSEAFYELARVQAYLGNHDEAIRSVQRLSDVTSRGETWERGQVLMAEVYYLKKDFDHSLAALKKFKADHPDSPLMENVETLLPRVQSAASAQ